MTNGMKIALINGCCVLGAALIGLWGGIKLNNNISIAINGESIKFNGKEIQELILENKDLKNNITNLQGEIKEKRYELENLQGEIQNKDNDVQTLKADVIENISLVVDSVGAPNKYIGVAQNGELLLSTVALGEYLGKPVTWDSTSKIVYIGNTSDKTAQKISLWDKPYKNIQHLQVLINNKEKHQIGFAFKGSDDVPVIEEGNLCIKENHITYPLNGKALSISGNFGLDTNKSYVELQFFVYDQNGMELYVSPKLNQIAPISSFEINTEGVLEVEILARYKSRFSDDIGDAYIEDLTALTTDY